MNEAAATIHAVAHPDANIIFGSVIDDALGDKVRVTVIAAGFDRFDDAETEGRRPRGRRHFAPSVTPHDGERPAAAGGRSTSSPSGATRLDLGDDDFDVPSFLSRAIAALPPSGASCSHDVR